MSVESDDRLCDGLRILFKAMEYADDVDKDAQQFAVEIDCLSEVGLTTSEFRWLISKGLVTHVTEMTSTEDRDRRFHPSTDRMIFGRNSCFWLTEKGRRYFRSLFESDNGNGRPRQPSPWDDNGNPATCPIWDVDRQELRLGKVLIKQYKVSAQNQELILAAFQEEGWPPSILDPLPPHPEINPKRRLQDTVASLNRSQRNTLVTFHVSNHGQSVFWQLRRAR